MKHPDLPDNERRAIALGMLEGNIFTSLQFPEYEKGDMYGLVFMPIFFGAFSEYTSEEIDDIGFLWEEMSRAGPRSINGYPMFMSFHVCNQNDKAVVLEYYKILKIQREQFLGIDPDQNR